MGQLLVKIFVTAGARVRPHSVTRQPNATNMKATRATLATALAVVLCLGAGIRLNASEELTRAKELYRSASYDEALTLLDSMAPTVAPEEAADLQHFRRLCAVASDREEDATRAMTVLITAAPQYQLSEEDASPRVRTLFTEVRRSVMPTLVQRGYAEAKAAFDRKDPAATGQFDRVLTLLKDPDVAKDPKMADLTTVVTGFRDLSVAAAAPAPVATAAAPAVGATTAPRAGVPSATAPVIPPVAISQTLPAIQLRDK